MLYFNFAHYVDKNNMSLNEIHEKTGISRNTLNLLYQNKSKGIQLKTLDTLISFFDISVSDFIKKKHKKPHYSFSVKPLDYIDNETNDFEGDTYLSFSFETANGGAYEEIFAINFTLKNEILLIIAFPKNGISPQTELFLKSCSDFYKELICAEMSEKVIRAINDFGTKTIKNDTTVLGGFTFDTEERKNNSMYKSLLNDPIDLQFMWQVSLLNRDYKKMIKLKYNISEDDTNG